MFHKCEGCYEGYGGDHGAWRLLVLYELYIDSLTSPLAPEREEQVCGLEKQQGTHNEQHEAEQEKKPS